MEWSESAALGRHLRAFLWPLRDQGHAPPPGRMTQAATAASKCIVKLLQSYPTRVVHSRSISRRYRVAFTDARGQCKGPDKATWCQESIGGVLLSAEGTFFFVVSASLGSVAAWLPSDTVHRINEAESLGPLLLVATFASLLQDSDCLIFVDSSATEGALIKAYSSSPLLTVIAGAFWEHVGRVDAAVWISRIPSKLNMADALSREDLSQARREKWVQHKVVVPELGRWADLLPGPRTHAAASQKLPRKHRRQLQHEGR